jgi:hypothetical protein
MREMREMREMGVVGVWSPNPISYLEGRIEKS